MNTRSSFRALFGTSIPSINGGNLFSESKFNSFEHFSVELGKQLANVILKDLQAPGTVSNHDNSTNGLVNYIKSKF
jgi:hypothetical protein